jgi:peptidylprolyl isomerase
VRRPAVLVLAVSLALGACAALVAPAGATTARATSAPLDKVTVSTDTSTKPSVKFAKPFAVKKTADSVVTTGTGAALAAGQTITFDFLLVDARTGKQIQTSFGSSAASLDLDTTRTAPPLVNSLVGKTIGSRVLVALAPKEGLAKKLKSSKVKKDDTLLFVIDVKNVRTPLTRATGDPVPPVDGLPAVSLAADTGKPTITVPAGAAAPTTLVVQPLIKGSGPVVQAGQTISVQYTGVIWDTGKQFDSSWDRGQPLVTPIGAGRVIPGWDTGLVGQTVGSQVLLVVPPAEGYGSSGTKDGTIKGTDTLVFVVDILDAY